MAKVVLSFLNQGCGVEAFFSDSTSLRFYNSNSGSRIPKKTTPTPKYLKKQLWQI